MSISLNGSLQISLVGERIEARARRPVGYVKSNI